jgi:hypothetical protein
VNVPFGSARDPAPSAVIELAELSPRASRDRHRPRTGVLTGFVLCGELDVPEPADGAVAESPLIVLHVSAGFRVFLVLEDQWWRRSEAGAPIDPRDSATDQPLLC